MGRDPETGLEEALKEVFGFSRFRPGQGEIVDAILARKHVLAVMPTGAGKSLCYQFPAVYTGQKTVVISPLVALIDDQVAALAQVGVTAAKVHSGMQRDDMVAHWRRFAGPEANMLYLSPERLMQPRMIQALQRLGVGLFVVDEAHCISKWGADFRPDYEHLAELRHLFPEAVIAAFTATADKATRADIVQKLTGGDCAEFLKGFDRPNLSLSVRPKSNLSQNLLAFLADKQDQSGIVYCLSRKETDQISALLTDHGCKAIAYHAGKTVAYRREAQNRFMSEDAVIMVATIAFGMGIDKPDIRYVVHASLPNSVEAFYQEIGRAGRDGAPAQTLLFYGLQDLMRRQSMIFDGDGSEQHKLLEYKRLEALTGYCETTGCRRLALLSYFDEAVAGPCGNCDNCRNPPQVEDQTPLAKHLLSAIVETGESFGVGHIIDIVRGAKTEKIRARSHDKVRAYASAKTQSKRALQSALRQLISSSALRVNLQKFGALEVRQRGRHILRGNEPFLAKVLSETQGAKVPKQKPALASPYPPAGPQKHPRLLADLKALRLEIARDRNVPAYMIFSDKALMQMAHDRPTTQDQFLAISGVGKKKLEEFYARFSDLIARHVTEA